MTRGVRLVATAAILAGCARRPVEHKTGTAKRVVSVSPSTTEALFAIDDGAHVVGRSRYCDFPPEVSAVPIVGGFVDVDVEAILQLAPDLVVGARGPSSDHLAEALGRRGIATWFPETDSLAAIDRMILGLGERTDRLDFASRTVAEVDARVRAVERAVADEPTPRVLLVLDVAPVVAAGPKTFADELIARSHAVNVLSEGGAWQALGLERVADLSPDLVLDASSSHPGGASRIAADAPGWASVKAVRDGHVVVITDERVLRPGPRVAEGLAVLARAIHPNARLPSLRQ